MKHRFAENSKIRLMEKRTKLGIDYGKKAETSKHFVSNVLVANSVLKSSTNSKSSITIFEVAGFLFCHLFAAFHEALFFTKRFGACSTEIVVKTSIQRKRRRYQSRYKRCAGKRNKMIDNCTAVKNKNRTLTEI